MLTLYIVKQRLINDEVIRPWGWLEHCSRPIFAFTLDPYFASRMVQDAGGAGICMQYIVHTK